MIVDIGGGNRKSEDVITVDIKGSPTVKADAHFLPFRSSSVYLVKSRNSLEHFFRPEQAINEVHRILGKGGLFKLTVPFMHGFHGTDYYRFTPLALMRLLGNFEILSLTSPLREFTFASAIPRAIFYKLHLKSINKLIKRICAWLDGLIDKYAYTTSSLSVSYFVLARKWLR